MVKLKTLILYILLLLLNVRVVRPITYAQDTCLSLKNLAPGLPKSPFPPPHLAEPF